MARGLKIHLPIIGLATLLLLPALFSPTMLRDSFWIDWVWSDQFTTELAKGHLYPRWFPLANGGAGSPTFYFYPPLAFYVSGLADNAWTRSCIMRVGHGCASRMEQLRWSKSMPPGSSITVPKP